MLSGPGDLPSLNAWTILIICRTGGCYLYEDSWRLVDIALYVLVFAISTQVNKISQYYIRKIYPIIPTSTSKYICKIL